MVKFGRKINGMQCPFFSASQQFQGIQQAGLQIVLSHQKTDSDNIT